jgi:FdhD protein
MCYPPCGCVDVHALPPYRSDYGDVQVFGKCLLEGISTEGRAVITTGRVSSEILHKVAKRGIPIVISISAPTNLGVRIADTLDITLVTSVRGKSMNVYTAPRRITHDGR